MQPAWQSPNAEVESLTGRMPQDPRLPRTSPITPFLGLPQMSASPNPLAAAHHAAQQVALQAAQQNAQQYSMPQYYNHGMQTSPLMLGTNYNGRMVSTQTSPLPVMYANTQTSPQPLSPPTPGPVAFGPSPMSSSSQSQRSSRSSCRYGYSSASDKVCERCGESSWVTREQYFVLRMRRKAARFAMRYQTQPPHPAPNACVYPASLPSGNVGHSAASLPRPSPRPACQSTAVISPSAWRPWTASGLDYQDVKARAEAAMSAHKRTLVTHRTTSTSYTKQEPEEGERKC